ncbi:uncharacterized protein N0V89_008811 [Didymosphaeria variabile]|uniref:Haloacid dehalogenase n=1 Tax=Didymosphaeria variabile TaxID=1932322 RepID=A0A9W8XGM4_9PLEO|nr:uncharacterized protein N0V89_008811 [Didymosphaeria variabile]KAJ4350190.1 hypothetical protein N0V89_008811 [Didymosphaeria variabile]
MQATRPLARKNLLLCFDAFDTLYKPNLAVPAAYAFAAQRHGISCVADDTSSKPVEKWNVKDYEPVHRSFKQAFKHQSAENPNYGKVTGLGAERWWANVIRGTFLPFLKPQQEVPDALISELLKRYSSSEGYKLFPDAKALFDILRQAQNQASSENPWKWDRTVVGVISNSDDRVPSVLSSLGLNVASRRVGSTIQHVAVSEDISFVVHSYDVGYEKPDSRIFNAATDILAASSASLGSIDDYKRLYVGDSLNHDYIGAEKAGWHAVLIDRHGSEKEWRAETERKTPLQTKWVEGEDGKRKKIVVVNGLDELVNWHPKNKWSGERPGRRAQRDRSRSGQEP